MLYWECKRRLERLRAFHANVCGYFNIVEYSGFSRTVARENQLAQSARIAINSAMRDVVESLALVGEPASVYRSDPPALGGTTRRVHVIENLFLLQEMQIDPRLAVDALYRAIGQYERLKSKLFWQLFNPLFWVEWLLGRVLAVPFRIFAAAGFDADRIEHSWVGKDLKAVTGIVIFAAAFLAILDYLGWLAWFRELLNAVLGRD